ncbi:MAG TPA: hypothetical protein VJI73_01990 [Candidatus Paceibacterota bacterium]
MKISNLLERFQNFDKNESKLRLIVAKTIKDITNIEIDNKNISYTNGVLFIQADSLAKSEIYLHKTGIISIIKTYLPKPTVNDLQFK